MVRNNASKNMVRINKENLMKELEEQKDWHNHLFNVYSKNKETKVDAECHMMAAFTLIRTMQSIEKYIEEANNLQIVN